MFYFYSWRIGFAPSTARGPRDDDGLLRFLEVSLKVNGWSQRRLWTIDQVVDPWAAADVLRAAGVRFRTPFASICSARSVALPPTRHRVTIAVSSLNERVSLWTIKLPSPQPFERNLNGKASSSFGDAGNSSRLRKTLFDLNRTIFMRPSPA